MANDTAFIDDGFDGGPEVDRLRRQALDDALARLLLAEPLLKLDRSNRGAAAGESSNSFNTGKNPISRHSAVEWAS